MPRRSVRVCSTPDCPNLTDGGSKCTTCRSADNRVADAKRPSSSARGYDRDHRAERAGWTPKVNTGTVTCRRCGRLILPHQPWDLGHDDNDRSAPRAPEHARCNRATKTHAAARRRH